MYKAIYASGSSGLADPTRNKVTKPATRTAARIGIAKMMGVPKTPPNTWVNAVVGSTVAAAKWVDVDESIGDDVRSGTAVACSRLVVVCW